VVAGTEGGDARTDKTEMKIARCGAGSAGRHRRVDEDELVAGADARAGDAAFPWVLFAAIGLLLQR